MPISNCPSCEIAMEVQNYEDVLIDVCPSCRGVWLDRGELHKIIAHVRKQEAETPSDFGAAPRRSEPVRRYDDDDRRHDDRRDDRRRKKRGFWDLIEEIID